MLSGTLGVGIVLRTYAAGIDYLCRTPLSLPPPFSSPLCCSFLTHSSRFLLHPISPHKQVEKEDRRKQNFAQASRDDGAWSKIVAQKEAELQAAGKESQ
jgi:hypothetical protein